MTWSKVSTVLTEKTKKKGKSSVFLASLVCYAAMEIGHSLFEPVSFKNGTLFVRAKNPSSATALLLSQNQILKEINQKLGKELVKEIKIKNS